MLHYIIIFSVYISLVHSYNNRMFTIINYENISESQCGVYNTGIHDVKRVSVTVDADSFTADDDETGPAYSFVTIKIVTPKPVDPLIGFEKTFIQVLYGNKELKSQTLQKLVEDNITADSLAHWPTGRVMRAETFLNKSSVHLPFLEYMHRGHCHLKVTKDYMQTAVDAFAIFISGDLSDVQRLPDHYVLRSARTIAMMHVAREKLVATWDVVRGDTPTESVPFETLELFRPLFKYINGKEMARLNLSDNRILSFIGTHPDLNRHQVGVVASRYIQLNPRWTEAKYLNMMNNLLCGVPMIFMRRIPENTYLQLSHQIFYHIQACDPLQRRFYLAMMMKTQALGKAYSWSARVVSRVGLLLTEVSICDLTAIKPEAMSGISSEVMLQMPVQSLKAITDMQLRYLQPKTLNVLARRLITQKKQMRVPLDPDFGQRISSPLNLKIYLCLYLTVLEIH